MEQDELLYEIEILESMYDQLNRKLSRLRVRRKQLTDMRDYYNGSRNRVLNHKITQEEIAERLSKVEQDLEDVKCRVQVIKRDLTRIEARIESISAALGCGYFKESRNYLTINNENYDDYIDRFIRKRGF